MNDSDPTLPSYLVEVRVSATGDGSKPFVAYAPRLGQFWTAVGATEREALGEMCRTVTGVIRSCRANGNSPIPWIPQSKIPPIVTPGEFVRRCAINMPTPAEEELWRVLDDRNLIACLVQWAKRPAGKRALKQQRKVAARLHELGYVTEARAVVRHDWAKWQDAADIGAGGGGKDGKRLRETMLAIAKQAAEASFREKRDRRATMYLWWRQLHTRMQADVMDANPSYVDKADEGFDPHEGAVREVVGEYRAMRPEVRRQWIESSLMLDEVQANRDAAETERRKRNREAVADLMRGLVTVPEKEVVELREVRRDEQR